MFQQIIFYWFALAAIFAGAMVITVRNPVHAALFLVLAFFSSAGLWLMLEAEFLAIALVLVYVGAVMVLFLFVVMMLDINIAVLREGFARYLPIAAVVALMMFGAIGYVVGPRYFGLDAAPSPAPAAASYSNTEAIGKVLYTDYVLPFEAAAVILLVAIVAAIALTHRGTRQSKAPRPERQVQVRRADRVRLIKMDAERGG
ncbi:MAG: NADH-quinone oxidoreductase subunit J [Gammaproteobacteria bacterium]|nr:NADH-quinone oxidoreductase subunit J [Gammaproteobacteria bacterium]MBI5617020.1 NADH-quinone oxidoreductase subunit J [Gammaproteobacteria bacterium]